MSRYSFDEAGRPIVLGFLVYTRQEWDALDRKPALPMELRSGHIAAPNPNYIAPPPERITELTDEEPPTMNITQLEQDMNGKRVTAPSATPFTLPAREAEEVWTDMETRGRLPWLVERFACGGLVTLLSGPPKKGKSTLLAQLVDDRRLGLAFLDRASMSGPTLLLSEEGEYPFTYRWRQSELEPVKGPRGFGFVARPLPPFEVVFRADVVRGKRYGWTDVLAGIESWIADMASEYPGQVPLVIIDTLLVWAGIEDENDSAGTSGAVAMVAALAQNTGAAVIVVHHTRKGGGAGGEAIRGSSAIYATVDLSIEFRAPTESSDDRKLHVTGRVVLPESVPLAFDRSTMRYGVGQDDDDPGDNLPQLRNWLAAIPDELVYSTIGFKRTVAQECWDLSRHAAENRLDGLVSKGLLEAAPTVTVRGGAQRMWRAKALLPPAARRDHADDH